MEQYVYSAQDVAIWRPAGEDPGTSREMESGFYPLTCFEETDMTDWRSQNNRKAFTLVELMVVIVIIAILAALLLPAVQAARDAGRRSSFSNNLKQIGLAMLNFENAYKGLPPRRNGPTWIPAVTNKGYCGWGAVILPYLELKNIQRLYQYDYNFYDPQNAEAVAKTIAVYSCPATQPSRSMTICDVSQNPAGTGIAGDYFAANSIRAWWFSNSATNSAYSKNTETAMLDNRFRALAEITDGASYTLLATEQAGRPDWYIKGARQLTTSSTASPNTVTTTINGTAYTQSNPAWWGCWASYQVASFWTYSDDGLTVDGTNTINMNNSQGIYAFHRGGANAVFCDGAVHFLGEGLAPYVFGAIITARSGGVDSAEVRSAESLGGSEF
jgi:prepilin-type N-terminal cleavage/methylation domain-containing protein/prepilin-type processing-associated H-X9-DG protein